MTRGNQRENDRAKAQKKLAQMNQPKQSGASLAAKKLADAQAIKDKEIAKKQREEAIARGEIPPDPPKKKGKDAKK